VSQLAISVRIAFCEKDVSTGCFTISASTSTGVIASPERQESRDLRDRTAMFAGGKVFGEPLGEHIIRAEGSERNQPIQIALFPEAATARSLRGADRSPSSCLLE
jgi:hypothetical protein